VAEPTGERPRRITRWVVGVGLLLVYVGALVAYGYSVSNRTVIDVDPPADGVTVIVQPTAIDIVGGTMDVQLELLLGDLVDPETGLLARELVVRVVPSSSPTLVIPAGSEALYANRTVKVPVDVTAQNYPFDAYQVPLIILVASRDAADGPLTPVPVSAGVQSDLLGWVVRRGDLTDQPLDLGDGTTSVALSLRRAGSTIAISLLLLSLMVVLGVLGARVARAVALGRRRVEAGFASWFAAMLFALIPLRLNLPGAPPLGAWIDYLVFFWVLVVLIVSLAVFIDAWLRTGPRLDA
jgi:hypothetical protein